MQGRGVMDRDNMNEPIAVSLFSNCLMSREAQNENLFHSPRKIT